MYHCCDACGAHVLGRLGHLTPTCLCCFVAPAFAAVLLLLKQVTPHQMADIARFCNAYPNVEVNYAIEDEDEVSAGDAVTLVATLQREEDEEEEANGDATADVSRH